MNYYTYRAYAITGQPIPAITDAIAHHAARHGRPAAVLIHPAAAVEPWPATWPPPLFDRRLNRAIVGFPIMEEKQS